MAPLMEVPPPKSWRGARSMAPANAAALSSSPTRPHPLQHGHGDRPVRSGADGLQHACMPECSNIAALLQLEADLIDATRCIDREHERKIGCALRGCLRGAGKQQQQCQPDKAADCGPL